MRSELAEQILQLRHIHSNRVEEVDTALRQVIGSTNLKHVKVELKNNMEAIRAEVLDELLAGQDPATVMQSDGLMGELKAALAERILNTEMDVHLHSEAEQQAGNHRNGTSQKTVLSDDGELVLSIPRDRHGRFDPALDTARVRRFTGHTCIAVDIRGVHPLILVCNPRHFPFTRPHIGRGNVL